MKRDNIKIKTKYESVSECMDSFSGMKKISLLSTSFSRDICGEIYDDMSFVLSSRAKGSAMFLFTGMIKEENDGIYLVGDICPKKKSKIIVYMSMIIFLIVGILSILTWNPIFFLFGILSFIVPFLNLLALKTSDYLYKDIVRRVG